MPSVPELYDLPSDLEETKNVAAALLKTLFAQFQALQKEMDDLVDATPAFTDFLNNVPPLAQNGRTGINEE